MRTNDRSFVRLVGLFLTTLALVAAPLGAAAYADPGDGGSISGTVHGAGGSALDGGQVTVMTTAGDWVDGTSVDNGSFELDALDPGDYLVQIQADGYQDWWYDGATTQGASTPVSVSDDDGAIIDATLVAVGTISGTVTGPAADPVAGIEVDELDADGNWVTNTTTAADGTYTLDAKAPRVVVQFTDYNGLYASEYFDDANDFTSATQITVPSAAQRGGVDAQLAIDGQGVTGRVTGAGDIPLADVDVTAYCDYGYGSGFEECNSTATGDDGRYALGLEADTDYKLGFAPEDNGTSAGYTPEFYNDKATLATADAVSLTSQQIRTFDAQLGGGATVSGHVSGGGHAAVGVSVDAYRYDSDWWNPVASTVTDSSGDYTIGVAGGAAIRLCFADNGTGGDAGYTQECWDDASYVDDAQDIAVTSGAAVTGKDADLQTLIAVSGTVTRPGGAPASDATVDLASKNGNNWYGADTDNQGKYTAHVSPGSYKVTAGADGYATGKRAGLVTVVDSPLTGIDIQLGALGHITGTITGGGADLADAEVTACVWSDDGYCDDDYGVDTDASGHYDLALTPGTYRLRFASPNDSFLGEYYDNAKSFAHGTDVVVTGGDTASANADLAAAGGLTGQVTAAVDSAPISGALVQVYAPDRLANSGWAGVASANTDGTGRYAITGLVPGVHYRIGFSASNFAESFVADQTVTGGAPTTLSQVLTAGLTLGGTVNGVSSAHLSGIDVIVQRRMVDRHGKYYWTGYDTTTSNGSGLWQLGVSPGTYRVQFVDPTDAYLAQYYQTGEHKQDAVEVSIASGSNTGLNATLQAAGAIHGTVNGPAGAGNPLADAEVDLYQQQEDGVTFDYVDDISTGSGGSYAFAGLRPGNYKVGFSADAMVPEYYDGQSTLADGTVITISSGADQAANADLAALPTHTVMGTVTGGEAGPLSGVDVTARQKFTEGGQTTWEYYDETSTDASGHYTLNLLDGDYRVEFHGGGTWATQYYNNSVDPDHATTVHVAGANLVGQDAALHVLPQISGHVTGSDSSDAANVQVSLYRNYGGYWEDHAWATTDKHGNYHLSVQPGTYRLGFYSQDGKYLGRFHTGKTSVETADDVTVGIVDVTADEVLPVAGSISGTVTPPAAATLSNLDVTVYRADPQSDDGWSYVNDDYVGDDADYEVRGLDTGDYKVAFTAKGMTDEFWNDKSDLDNADVVHVTAGAEHGGVDAELAAAGVGPAITGTVTDKSSSAALGDVDVVAERKVANNGDENDWRFWDSTSTDDDGTYRLKLSAGTYRVSFLDEGSDYPTAWYGGVDAAHADSLTLTTTTVTADAQLTRGGSIAGTVKWPNAADKYDWNSEVSAVDADGIVVATAGVSSDDPYYALTGLPAGSYRLDFARNNGFTAAEAQFGFGHPEGAGVGAVNLLNVTSSGQLVDQDATLRNGAVLTGTITDPAHHALEDCTLSASTANGSLTDRVSYTEGNGAFAVRGLTGGSYRLGADCGDGVRYWTGTDGAMTTNPAGAGPVTMAELTDRTLATPLVYGTPTVEAGTPTISPTGTPKVLDTLTADAGDWPSGTTLSYQWLAGDDDDSLSPVGGATNTTFPVAEAQLGKRLAVRVTGSQTGFDDGIATSALTAAVVRPAITNTATPSIDGSAAIGSTLHTDGGSWTPVGVTLLYQWKSGGTSVGTDSDSDSYTLVADDVGKTVTVTVIASKSPYSSASATSAAKGPVTNQPAIANLTKPAISGTAAVGSQLTATQGTWSQTGVSAVYQWFAGTTVVGTNTSVYTPAQADLSKPITVRVTAQKSGYTDGDATSAPTAAVAAAAITNTTAPQTTGTARVGKKLSTDGGSWSESDVILTYQWLRNGAMIAHASSSTYTLGAADRGRSISVRVTAAKAGFSDGQATSSAKKVAAGVISGSTPKVSGKAKVGKKLTAKAGSTAPSGVAIHYQWLRNGKVIKHATKSKYKLTKKDKFKKVSVRVTRTKSGYAALVRTSSAKKVKK